MTAALLSVSSRFSCQFHVRLVELSLAQVVQRNLKSQILLRVQRHRKRRDLAVGVLPLEVEVMSRYDARSL